MQCYIAKVTEFEVVEGQKKGDGIHQRKNLCQIYLHSTFLVTISTFNPPPIFDSFDTLNLSHAFIPKHLFL